MKWPCAAGQALADDLAAAAQIDQPHLRPVADDHVAIGPLEGGAGDDSGLSGFALTVDPGGHGGEPGRAIRIGQGNAGMHLGDIRLGMQRIALLEGPAQLRREFLGHGGLARAGDAHDHEDRRPAAMGMRAVEAMDAAGIGDEDRIGPADEEAAFDHPDDAPDALLQPRRIGDRAEAAIEDAVAAVGDEGLARRASAAAWRLAPSASSRALVTSRPKVTTSTGTGALRSQPIDQLGAVDDDGKPPAGGGDDLLAQQRAAQPLDQVQRAALDLVGAVDREIDLADARRTS